MDFQFIFVVGSGAMLYCIMNAIGISRCIQISPVIGGLVGIFEFICILLISGFALWVFGAFSVLISPIIIFAGILVKSLSLGVFRDIDSRGILHGMLLFGILVVIFTCVVIFLGLPLVSFIFPDISRSGQLIWASILTYWVLTSYPYLLKWQQSGSNK